MSTVSIKFDANQDYQLQAVDSVANLFEGLSKEELGNEYSIADYFSGAERTDSVSNVYDGFEFEPYFLSENYNNVRRANGLPNIDKQGKPISFDFNDGVTLMSETEFYSYPAFTINMETGTGKTYVYLRTIYRLNELYGFRKFIVVVPSVAIYEGALATFKATLSHFATIFKDSVPQTMIDYDGNVTDCKSFGTETGVAILLMTIDSFNTYNKTTNDNVIYKPHEKIRGGILPINYIQDCRPILILDEVQNYKSDNALKALRTLHPLFSVGYSATPGKDVNNELYRLSSFEASQKKLVKRIEVSGFQEEQTSVENPDYFKIIKIRNTQSVDVELAFLVGGTLQLDTISIGPNTLFSQKTHNNEYGNLSIVKISIKKEDTYVELSNGMRYCEAQTSCASLSKEAVFRQMISETIATHIEKQSMLLSNGYNAKVLSLFFIDKVASYKGDDALVARLFDEEFEKLKGKVSGWKNLKGADVREGYFAKKPKPKSDEFEYIDKIEIKTKEDKIAEKIAYELIMKDKERLLSFDEKVCFIFAHSALREGWDNPNVFQICSLREITSESNRRQTIGRGLRLPVAQNGERIHNDRVNCLTVIANETYARFAKKLQDEYEADGVIMNENQITNKKARVKVNRTESFNSTEFDDIWRMANRGTEYTIKIKTDELIKEAIERINATTFAQPRLVCTKGVVKITVYSLKLLEVHPNGEALFNVTISDNLQENIFGETGKIIALKKGDKLGSKCKELERYPELCSKKVSQITYNGNNPEHSSISLSGETPWLVDEEHKYQTTYGGVVATKDIKVLDYPDIPKCNIIERASKEVKLTRKTVFAIFKGVKKEHQLEFMKNPEGFSSQFIIVLKDVVANHIAKNIVYNRTKDLINDDVDTLFPKYEYYSKDEVEDINNEKRSIYNKVQVDSSVERRFVNRLDNSDEQTGNVQLYFKFPPKYKIKLPKIIGNYNPDWAIVRRNEQQVQLSIVRETKGTEDLKNLWHSNEFRKIICAQKHFREIGLEYKVVDDKDANWWIPNEKDYADEVFGSDKE